VDLILKEKALVSLIIVIVNEQDHDHREEVVVKYNIDTFDDLVEHKCH
jgi:hypothetical protein